ncbi:vacuolar amino acid permease [Punctularia strigosozonata HHB-11173 SS5]|uniref:vacuolar amino acid permease n=1 Tax=Punctularia strigosozonata (strain HHB-11173) TaxID=741275 RepID=UPI0004417DEC|nr:vacuolar amino acid permease [Punctularia strigosozonata HHB-11173 SS5]EIN07892.1 vacuolar amino acid permease [Punctularia strigosozonata HHB-11173 SS5]
MSAPSERDPLLSSASSSTIRRDEDVSDSGSSHSRSLKAKAKGVGPLEITRSTRYGILAGIWVATFLSAVNTTLVATLIPSISSEFQKSNQASWLGTAYLLATCTFTPLYGRLCNVLGRRGANQCAVIFAGLGTLACGLSRNMETLILARFLCGIGGGGVFVTASIITSDMYSLRERGLSQGIMNIFNGLGMGLGGPIGGLLTDWFGWRWAFLTQAPLFLVSILLTSWNLRYVTPGKGQTTKEILKRIDYAGSLVLMGAVLSVLIFLSNRFNLEYSWTSVGVIVPLVLGFVLALLFVYIELRWAVEPVMAPWLLRHKITMLVSASNFLVANCNFAIQFFFPMWFQTVLLRSASNAGLHMTPNSISMSTGSLFAGWMLHRTGKYKLLSTICGIFPFIACLLITQIREDSGFVQEWLSIIPMGFGNAVVLQTMLSAMLAHLPENAVAVGTGFGTLFRGIGQVGGVAISSALFQSRLDKELRRRIHGPDAHRIITSIRHSAQLVHHLPPELQRKARDSYAIAIKAVFTFAAVATGLAFLVRLAVPEKELDHAPGKKVQDDEERGEGIVERLEEEQEGDNDLAGPGIRPPDGATLR